MPSWCRLAILTDEVSQELDDVLRFAREFRLAGIELRSLFGQAFKDLSPAQITEIAHRSRDAGLAVAGCATPVFKCPLDSSSEIAAHLELFRRSIEFAQILGCDLLRVFTFLRRTHPATSDDLARAAGHVSALLDLVRGTGLRIGVENESSCIVATGAEAREFLGHLPNDPQLGIVWDPCNVLYLDGGNDPVHDDFPQVAGRTIHVHVKDASRVGTKAAENCVELGTGQIDFRAQFRALKDGGFRGWITLETHWRTVALDEASRHLPAGYGFSANAEPASRICMARLQSLVNAA
jgi:sugar phosphate isomerase/epimerase